MQKGITFVLLKRGNAITLKYKIMPKLQAILGWYFTSEQNPLKSDAGEFIVCVNPFKGQNYTCVAHFNQSTKDWGRWINGKWDAISDGNVIAYCNFPEPIREK
jgi:hypothetical protein